MAIFKKIQSEYKRFIKKEYRKYFDIDLDNTEPFTNLFVTFWKDYYLNNKDILDDKFSALYKGMDEQSKELAYLLWDRYINMHPSKEYVDKLILKNLDCILTSTEKDLRSKYKNQKLSGLEYLNSTDFLKDKHIIDGGAYIGDSALDFIRYFPSKIFSFEPDASNYKKLEQTIAENNLADAVIPIKKGLGDTEQENIRIYGEKSGSTVLGSGDNYQEISVTTIDKAVKENSINPALIKLDIEGFELEAIKGAINTIKEYKPYLLISIYHTPKDLFEIKPLLESLNLEYKFKIRKLNHNSCITEFILIAYFE